MTGRRRLEHLLREMGASRSESTGGASALPTEVCDRIAPWIAACARWHRFRLALDRLALRIGAWMR